jgi:hypothetical protein
MRKRSKLALAGLTVASVLGFAVGSASANILEVSNRAIRAVWSELRIAGGGFETRCPVTLEGSFHGTAFGKTSGNLIGYITRAIVVEAQCVGAGPAMFLNNGAGNTLPWHIRSNSFEGTLPNITGFKVQVLNLSILINISGLSCLYRSSAAKPWRATFKRRVETMEVTGLESDATAEVPKFAGELLCPAEVRLSNTGEVTLLGTTTKIRIRLI